tara:strand:+ start:494 stop:1213 length:720 start_codon:yes stop_codon:yes gene_type:complete
VHNTSASQEEDREDTGLRDSLNSSITVTPEQGDDDNEDDDDDISLFAIVEELSENPLSCVKDEMEGEEEKRPRSLLSYDDIDISLSESREMKGVGQNGQVFWQIIDFNPTNETLIRNKVAGGDNVHGNRPLHSTSSPSFSSPSTGSGYNLLALQHIRRVAEKMEGIDEQLLNGSSCIKKKCMDDKKKKQREKEEGEERSSLNKDGGERMTITDQVDALIEGAVSPYNLSQLYEGWLAWM